VFILHYELAMKFIKTWAV